MMDLPVRAQHLVRNLSDLAAAASTNSTHRYFRSSPYCTETVLSEDVVLPVFVLSIVSRRR